MEKGYRTTDIGVASYLIAKGHVLVRIEPNGQRARQVWFVFNEDAGADGDQYWNDTGMADPKELFAIMRDLKARLFNEVNK